MLGGSNDIYGDRQKMVNFLPKFFRITKQDPFDEANVVKRKKTKYESELETTCRFNSMLKWNPDECPNVFYISPTSCLPKVKHAKRVSTKKPDASSEESFEESYGCGEKKVPRATLNVHVCPHQDFYTKFCVPNLTSPGWYEELLNGCNQTFVKFSKKIDKTLSKCNRIVKLVTQAEGKNLKKMTPKEIKKYEGIFLPRFETSSAISRTESEERRRNFKKSQQISKILMDLEKTGEFQQNSMGVLKFGPKTFDLSPWLKWKLNQLDFQNKQRFEVDFERSDENVVSPENFSGGKMCSRKKLCEIWPFSYFLSKKTKEITTCCVPAGHQPKLVRKENPCDEFFFKSLESSKNSFIKEERCYGQNAAEHAPGYDKRESRNSILDPFKNDLRRSENPAGDRDYGATKQLETSCCDSIVKMDKMERREMPYFVRNVAVEEVPNLNGRSCEYLKTLCVASKNNQNLEELSELPNLRKESCASPNFGKILHTSLEKIAPTAPCKYHPKRTDWIESFYEEVCAGISRAFCKDLSKIECLEEFEEYLQNRCNFEAAMSLEKKVLSRTITNLIISKMKYKNIGGNLLNFLQIFNETDPTECIFFVVQKLTPYFLNESKRILQCPDVNCLVDEVVAKNEKRKKKMRQYEMADMMYSNFLNANKNNPDCQNVCILEEKKSANLKRLISLREQSRSDIICDLETIYKKLKNGFFDNCGAESFKHKMDSIVMVKADDHERDYETFQRKLRNYAALIMAQNHDLRLAKIAPTQISFSVEGESTGTENLNWSDAQLCGETKAPEYSRDYSKL